MKIAFVGKGGSGKSTLATLFSYYLAQSGDHILAIDADINQHFGTLLGITEAEMKTIRSLGHEIGLVRTYIQGENKRVVNAAHFRMTTPPATGSNAVQPNTGDPLLSNYILKKNGIHFVTTGEFEISDVGMICYHGKTMATEIVLNHMADAKNEYVVVDMTAGADAFSTGIFLKFDLIVLVVEPTAQSLSVYKQFMGYGEEYGINLKVVGNKIETEEDEKFIKNNVSDAYLGSLPFTKEMRSLEKGMGISPTLAAETKPVMDSIKRTIDSTQKNWIKFYNDLVALHKKHAESWLNDSFQTKFEDQIDPTFDPEAFFAR